MISNIIKFFFGSSNDRTLSRINKLVTKINDLEPQYQALSDQQLQAKTNEFKQRIADGETLQSIAIEAFATVREASVRILGMRPFDVQLIGAFVLCENSIAEMKTGEGKTLTSTLAVYLHALTGKGVHVITVNDYLARRDATNNSPLLNFLGISVEVNLPMMTPEEKIKAYSADVTYGTNSEFGFDYLRDNLVQNPEQRVQRKLFYAIVDEVDSILIDEARTPLVISGAAEDDVQLYQIMNQVIPQLTFQDKEDSKEYTGDGDYTINLKSRQAFLTERGQVKVEEILIKMGILQPGESLYALNHSSILHHLMAALRAHSLFEKDIHYIVKDGEVLIIDEHTGRIMEGRRWGEGNHQAIEAKEGVAIRSENVTIASITYQNYFRLYQKLAGMTGTADTEAFEFQQIYGLNTIVVPTNKPISRIDKTDLLFKTEKAKFNAIIKEIQERISKDQPVLVGTASVEKSEILSQLLDAQGIKHNVLNAKFHDQEADIIAQAGSPGAVTIATNMAGRGTDIILGGNLNARIAKLKNPSEEAIAKERISWEEDNKKVKQAGGLHIIGTERHESRRIDNQLRGRSGRQGDAGSSQFFLSLEDNLLKIFIPETRLKTLGKSFHNEEDYLDMKIMSRIIASAQAKVESHNFDIRKQLIEYDDVANQQRSVIYNQRNYILEHKDISPILENMVEKIAQDITEQYLPAQQILENWDFDGFKDNVHQEFGLVIDAEELVDAGAGSEEIAEVLESRIKENFAHKKEQIGDNWSLIQKSVLLKTLDDAWREQIHYMDDLRKSIHLRGYAQKDPKQEYKKESFAAFEVMINRINVEAIGMLCKIQFEFTQPEQKKVARSPFSANPSLSFTTSGGNQAQRNTLGLTASATALTAGIANEATAKEEELDPNDPIFNNVGRNQECPCGSGKRFKHCHGKLK